jgi:hypothetical protein
MSYSNRILSAPVPKQFDWKKEPHHEYHPETVYPSIPIANWTEKLGNYNDTHDGKPPVTEAPAVGDVLNSAKGSGARYNNNKVPYEYLPLELLLDWLDNEPHVKVWNGDSVPKSILYHLSRWHSGNEASLDRAIDVALDDDFTLQGFAEAAKVFQHVTTRKVKPYPAWNWKKGMPWLVPHGCAIRHVLAEMSGIELDDETGFRHRGHTLCNLIMLLEFRNNYLEGDNRPPKII